MKAKWPKSVWLTFQKNGLMDSALRSKPERKSWLAQHGYTAKRYHLHPGNEVAKTLNVLNKYTTMLKGNESFSAAVLHAAGFRVRWDAKAGKFK